MADSLRHAGNAGLSPAAAAPLCRLADIPDGGTRGFTIQRGGEDFELFVLRRGDGVLAYENSCPHLGSPLDWKPDTFLTAERTHFICATHGALFCLEDGYCLAGPCRGARLRAVAVEVAGGAVHLKG